MKLCQDCKWIVMPLSPETNMVGFRGPRWVMLAQEPMCNAPNASHSRVDGRPLQEAERLRGYRVSDCGPEGRWFEPKPQPEAGE